MRVAIAVLLAFAVMAAMANEEQQKEGIVKFACMLDAGSTGSRIHVYVLRYIAESEVPIVEHDHFLEVKPGISSYKDDPSQAGPSIQKLLDFAYIYVPEAQRVKTTAHLKATAGLRLLPEHTQHALLESVRDTLQATPFKFDRSWVSVISGVEEAVGAWITVNYLLGKLDKEDTSGIVDLGGGSVQIACLPTEGSPPRHLTQEVIVGGRTFQLYVKSHLGYGLMQGRQGIHKGAIKIAGGAAAAKVMHPCLPAAHEATIGGQRHVGTGNYKECVALAEEWMKSGGSDLPLLSETSVKTKGRFLGFSYIYDVLPSFGLPKEPTLREVETKAQEICELSAKAVVDTYSAHTQSSDFTDHACIDMVYISALLKHLAHLGESERRMTIGKRIDGKELSWALGATLAVMGEQDAEELKQSHTRFYILMAIVAVIAIASFAIVGPKKKMSSKRREGSGTPSKLQ